MSRGVAQSLASPSSERTLAGLVRYFLKLGGSGFGGPIALVGYMQRDLVEQRGWFTESEFQQAPAVGQTMPGPLAAQVAMWLWLLAGGGAGRCRRRAAVRAAAVRDRHCRRDSLLRGQLDSAEQIEALVRATGAVEGVKGVKNLLHTK